MAIQTDVGLVSKETLNRKIENLSRKKDSVRAKISSRKMSKEAAEKYAATLRGNGYQVRLTVGCPGCETHSDPIAHIFVVIKK